MKISIFIILLHITVGCYGIKWRAINDFKEIFKEYSESAKNTIISIGSILESTRGESTIFLDSIFNNSLVWKVSGLHSSDDKCYTKFLNKDNFELSFQIQVYQLELPLKNRIIDIRERLKALRSTLDIYQMLADSKFWSCRVYNASCEEETNAWVESMIKSLACTIYPNCLSHLIRKRSLCTPGEFSCNGRCLSGNYFCDGSCNCNGCTDEYPGCVRDCTGFRCRETFRCVTLNEKCDRKDDCGDGSDEENCSFPPTYTRDTCSTHTGEFFCDSNKCIGLEQVCNGHPDCDDGSDEGYLCKNRLCSPDCDIMGGVCLSGPTGPKCLFECPPGTFETSFGCSIKPEAPLATLSQALEDTPRLTARQAARFKFLKTKTTMEVSKSLYEVVRCKREEFTLLSKVIQYSSDSDHKDKILSDDKTVAISTPPVQTTELLFASTTSESTSEGSTYDEY